MQRLTDRLNARLERVLPEQRLFLRSDTVTRYVRLRPLTQATALAGGGALLAWSIIATSILLMDAIGSGNLRDQAAREQANYELRLNTVAAERDRRAKEAEAAQERFAQAMEQVSDMQLALLRSEERRMELETGIESIQRTLQRSVRERDAARAQLVVQARGATDGELQPINASLRTRDAEETLDFLKDALDSTASGRDLAEHVADQYRQQAEHMAMQARLMTERNNRIFTQLEEAIELAMEPMERMFRNVNVQPQQILNAVRSGAQATPPALRPIAVSTQGTLAPDSIEMRANGVLEGLERLNRFRIGAARVPLTRPLVAGNVRQTSGFGPRRHPLTGRTRMHNGLDWAGPRGTPILATADGRVKHAGRRGGYGNLVIIEHDFGIETYYAHLNSIDVRQGQRVSRGDRIGGMGTTGASTGVHLHYEVRVGGTPVNPITYIRAGQNVF